MRSFIALSVVIVACSSAAGSEKSVFRNTPQVSRDGGSYRLTFTLDRPTDVEVAVLDPQGKIVRHLAAGVLGGNNPPPPPLRKGLEQQLTWDGKNDRGEPAGEGPFGFRVRVGTAVRMGKLIGGSPYTGTVAQMPYRAPVNGLTVDTDGSLYVLMMSSIGSHGNSGMWPWHLRKFDRDGQYIRTLLPYPPSTKPSQATGFQLLETPGGFSPANRTSLYPVFARFGNEVVSRHHDGQLVFVHSEKRELNFLALDGTNRVKTVPMWPASAKLHCPVWLDIQVALSPDGRYAYYSNVAGAPYDGRRPSDIDPRWPQGRIYRPALST
jgi:hypothetical protein